MRLRTCVSILALWVTALAAPNAYAQSTTVPSAESLGLRLETNRWGRSSIYDGSLRIGSVGIFSSDLERAVAGSEEAVRHARRFRQERVAGNAFVILGIAASTALLANYVQGDELNMGGWESAGMIAGAGAASYGTYRLVLSRRALDRSLQAFDRDRRR